MQKAADVLSLAGSIQIRRSQSCEGRVLDDTGSSTEQLLGSGWSQLVHPEDLAATAERWSRAVASGETYEAEFRIRDREGRYRWHLSRAVPLRDADEAVIRWVGTNTDIHDQKLAEAQSTRDRDRMWTMSQDLMLVCDFEGMITAPTLRSPACSAGTWTRSSASR